MAEEHVEIHEIGEEESVGGGPEPGDGFHAVGVGCGRVRRGDAARGEDVGDFSDAGDGDVGFRKGVEDVAGWGKRIVVTVGGALPCAFGADEWAGDHAADGAGVLACGFADGVEFFEGDDVFVRGDLEDGVGGCVKDRVAGAEVF